MLIRTKVLEEKVLGYFEDKKESIFYHYRKPVVKFFIKY